MTATSISTWMRGNVCYPASSENGSINRRRRLRRPVHPHRAHMLRAQKQLPINNSIMPLPRLVTAELLTGNCLFGAACTDAARDEGIGSWGLTNLPHELHASSCHATASAGCGTIFACRRWPSHWGWAVRKDLLPRRLDALRRGGEPCLRVLWRHQLTVMLEDHLWTVAWHAGAVDPGARRQARQEWRPLRATLPLPGAAAAPDRRLERHHRPLRRPLRCAETRPGHLDSHLPAH